MSEGIGPTVEKYLGFVLKRRREDALNFVVGLAESKRYTLLQLYHIIAASQNQVGALWAKGTITIADEHYATDVALEATELLSGRIKKFHREKINHALLANFVEGEYHTVGLKMFSELLKADGWHVELFGSPLHVANFFKYIDSHGEKFDLLCCSVTMEFNIEDLRSILKILRTNIHTREMKILVGSQLFSQQKYVNRMIDEETKKPLADFLANDFDSGIEFVRSVQTRD